MFSKPSAVTAICPVGGSHLKAPAQVGWLLEIQFAPTILDTLQKMS
jgi:hypothetical protein